MHSDLLSSTQNLSSHLVNDSGHKMKKKLQGICHIHQTIKIYVLMGMGNDTILYGSQPRQV